MLAINGKIQIASAEKIKLFVPYAIPHKEVKINAFINDLWKYPDILIYNDINKPQFNKSFYLRITKILRDMDYLIILNPSIESVNTPHYNPFWSIGKEWRKMDETQKFFMERIVYVFLNQPEEEREDFKNTGNSNIFDLSRNYRQNFIFLIEYIKNNSSNRLLRLPYDRKTAEQIIEITPQINEKLIRYYSNNPGELKNIDKYLFEELIAELFYTFGYSVELTNRSCDGGRDVIALKNDITNIKYLIECKRPDKNKPIGVRFVRELFGVKNDEKATKAILATTSYFSKGAMEIFERNIWELEPKDFDGVMDWIKKYNEIKRQILK